MMLDNGTYNKVKLLCQLSQIAWFIEKHALIDAQQAGDTIVLEQLLELQKNVQRHIERLQGTMCIVTQ